MSVKISVIIPVYNMKKKLKRCLENVLSQTIDDIEVICINDGSTDGSDRIIAGFVQKDKRVKQINQKNQGSGPARNAGIIAAQGEYISFMDADDFYYDESALEKMYKKAIANNALICGGKFIDGRDNSIRFFGSMGRDIVFKDRFIKFEDFQNIFGYQSYIYQTEFVKVNKIFFKPYRRYQDPPWMLEAMIKAKEFYSTDIDFYVYFPSSINPKWEKEKFVHILSGLMDVVQMSGENGLWSLHTDLYLWLKFIARNFPKKMMDDDFYLLTDRILNSFNFAKVSELSPGIDVCKDALTLYNRCPNSKKTVKQNLNRLIFFGHWKRI